MKKYVLPTLVSLALSSSWTWAQEPPTQEAPELKPPAAMPPFDDAMKQHREQMEKQIAQLREEQMAHRQEMQTLMDKLRQTTDPDERQRLMEEMQQSRQKMQEKMWKQGGMMSGMPYGPGGGYGPGMGYGPRGHHGPQSGYGWGGPGHYYGPGPRQDYPNRPFDRGGWMPEFPGPNYNDMPYSNRKPPCHCKQRKPGNFGKKMCAAHRAQVEQRLENLEKLLQQLVDSANNK